MWTFFGVHSVDSFLMEWMTSAANGGTHCLVLSAASLVASDKSRSYGGDNLAIMYRKVSPATFTFSI